jgi:hypothetical protein
LSWGNRKLLGVRIGVEHAVDEVAAVHERRSSRPTAMRSSRLKAARSASLIETPAATLWTSTRWVASKTCGTSKVAEALDVRAHHFTVSRFGGVRKASRWMRS